MSCVSSTAGLHSSFSSRRSFSVSSVAKLHVVSLNSLSRSRLMLDSSGLGQAIAFGCNSSMITLKLFLTCSFNNSSCCRIRNDTCTSLAEEFAGESGLAEFAGDSGGVGDLAEFAGDCGGVGDLAEFAGDCGGVGDFGETGGEDSRVCVVGAGFAGHDEMTTAAFFFVDGSFLLILVP